MRQCRKQSRDPFCHHRLPGSRRSHQQNIMKSCRRKQCSPLCRRLPFDLFKISGFSPVIHQLHLRCLHLFPSPISGSSQKFFQVFHSHTSDPRDHLRLFSVLPWNDTPLASGFSRFFHHRKHAPYFFDLSVQSHFTDQHDLFQTAFRKVSQ